MHDERDEFVARGPSTQLREVAGAGYKERFTREALVQAADQVASGYVKMNVEHLSFLPPIGHWHRAEVEDDEYGESHLVLYGHYLNSLGSEDLGLPDEVSEDDDWNNVEHLDNVTIGFEPRNFEADVLRNLKTAAPLPVVEHAARSALPPLIWIITIPVTWGVVQFSGSFLKRLGEAAADKLVGWIATHARLARDSSRDNMVEVVFEVADKMTVSAFIELNPSMTESVEDLRKGLEGLGSVADFAREAKDRPDCNHVRLVAFFHSEGSWNLGWWATEESAHLTNWFNRNYPDPSRFLGSSHLVISDPEVDEQRSPEIPPSSWVG